ncbi:MAG TPA: hypothetical protein VEB22_10235 [Phycisphaerales bacterium]|nr:hypothetical protein [Phycisphaerales bacterium]
MTLSALPAGLTLDLDEPSIIIVVGADLRAETLDRPIASALLRGVNTLLAKESAAAGTGRPTAAAVICTDVWYLNSNHLRLCPTISVGGPELNALSAYLIGRLPPVFAVENRYAVHADPRREQLAACVWGVDATNTAHAMDTFCSKHLPAFVQASVRVAH